MFTKFFGIELDNTKKTPDFNNMLDVDIAQIMSIEESAGTCNSTAYNVCINLLNKPLDLRRDHWCGGTPYIYLLWEMGITGLNIEILYAHVCKRNLENLEQILRQCNKNEIEPDHLMQQIDDAKAKKTSSNEKIVQIEFVGYILE